MKSKLVQKNLESRQYHCVLLLPDWQREAQCNNRATGNGGRNTPLTRSAGCFGALWARFQVKFKRWLLATTIALSIGTTFGVNSANASDCYQHLQAVFVMLELRQKVAVVTKVKNVDWYSTLHPTETAAAFLVLTGEQLDPEAPDSLQQIHFLNLHNGTFRILYSDSDRTCGFSEFIAVESTDAQRAISAAVKVLQERRSIRLKQTDDPYDAEKLLMEIRSMLNTQGSRDNYPDYVCEAVEFDRTTELPPEFDAIQSTGKFRGRAARYMKNFSLDPSELARNLFENVVADDDGGVNMFWNIEHVILIQSGENTDILLANNQHICGLRSFASFPTDIVNSWLEPYKLPERTTLPGDPVINMTQEERESFQLMQGIINGGNLLGGLQELFEANK